MRLLTLYLYPISCYRMTYSIESHLPASHNKGTHGRPMTIRLCVSSRSWSRSTTLLHPPNPAQRKQCTTVVEYDSQARKIVSGSCPPSQLPVTLAPLPPLFPFSTMVTTTTAMETTATPEGESSQSYEKKIPLVDFVPTFTY